MERNLRVVPLSQSNPVRFEYDRRTSMSLRAIRRLRLHEEHQPPDPPPQGNIPPTRSPAGGQIRLVSDAQLPCWHYGTPMTLRSNRVRPHGSTHPTTGAGAAKNRVVEIGHARLICDTK